MRWILGLLVLINVGILIWGSLDEDQPAQPQLAAPGVGTIRLAGEPESARPPDAVPIPAPPRSSGVMAKPPVVAESEAVSVGTAPEPVPPVVAEVPVPPPAPEVAVDTGETAVAADEPPEAEAVPSVDESKPEPMPRPKPARPRFCSRIGPFAKADDAQVLSDYLQKRGGQVQLREETRSMHAGYWVMIPPHQSRNDAKAVAETLKNKGIKDFWIIPKGEYQYAISLGVFSKQANAEAFAKRVVSKGFKVNTVDKLKERTATWLSYQGEVFIPPMEIAARVSEGVQAEDQDCP